MLANDPAASSPGDALLMANPDFTAYSVEEALDYCLCDPAADVEQCLALFPQHAAELRPLLLLAGDVSQSQQPVVSSLRRARLDRRILPSLRAEKPPTARPPGNRLPFRWRPLVLRLAVTCLLLVAFSYGTLVAAASSVPGDLLYAVKRGGEQVRLVLTADDVSRISLHLDLAGDRLHEIGALGERQQLIDADLLDDLGDHLSTARDLISHIPEHPAARALLDLSTRGSQTLQRMSNNLASDAAPAYAAAQREMSSSATLARAVISSPPASMLADPSTTALPSPPPNPTLPLLILPISPPQPTSQPPPASPPTRVTPTSEQQPSSPPLATRAPALQPTAKPTATRPPVQPTARPAATRPPVQSQPDPPERLRPPTATAPPLRVEPPVRIEPPAPPPAENKGGKDKGDKGGKDKGGNEGGDDSKDKGKAKDK